MEYLTIDTLKECCFNYLLDNYRLNETKARLLSDVLDTPDIIHQIDNYMSEYIGETEIDNEIYLHYHCWFEDEYRFTHETYYLKKDVEDGSIESYVKSHKLYSI